MVKTTKRLTIERLTIERLTIEQSLKKFLLRAVKTVVGVSILTTLIFASSACGRKGPPVVPRPEPANTSAFLQLTD